MEPPKKLSTSEKTNWNKFIDFVAMHNMSNSPVLDQRNKQVGNSLIQQYNFTNPKNALPNDITPRVQQELQDYRGNLISQYKAGKIQATPDIKSENDIMPTISPVDGWPGSKTLSHKFPVASTNTDNAGVKSTKDFGTDVAAFDKDQNLNK